ncbi:MAG: hypothetical protein QOI34_849 [Verrucomicrobiota bacterium]|jgi:hypothetical protein
MKLRMVRCLIVLAVWLSATLVSGAQLKTQIITSTGSSLVITVPEGHFLRISNFTQEGGSARGVVAATINGRTVNVLTASQVNVASLATPPEFINRVVVAGPATVTIAPVPGATLTISYRKVRDGDLASATPTPTATPTPIATPTPTP